MAIKEEIIMLKEIRLDLGGGGLVM